MSQSERESLRSLESLLREAFLAMRHGRQTSDPEQRRHCLRIVRRCFRKLHIPVLDPMEGPHEIAGLLEDIGSFSP